MDIDLTRYIKPVFMFRDQLIRAGAFGALYGGDTGLPQLGLIINLSGQNRQHFASTLSLLASKQQQATLLIDSDLTHKDRHSLQQATHAGHEFCLTGELDPSFLTFLEVTAGQAIQLSIPPQMILNRRLHKLTLQHLTPIQPSQQAKPGGLLLVHPSELATKINWLSKNGYQPKPVTQLLGLRQATPHDWLRHHYHRLIEDPYAKRSGLIQSSERVDALLRIAPLTHAPAPLPLPRHTPTAEIHVDSERLVGINQHSSLRAYRSQVRTFRDVAYQLEEHPKLKQAAAIFAVTLFTPALEKAGFELLDLPPLRAYWYGLGFRILRIVHGTTKKPSNTRPHMAWMSREQFLNKFG